MMPAADRLGELEKRHYVAEKGNAFQRRARLLQSIWRTEQGYGTGAHRGRYGERPLGSRLPMPWAEETLANYLSDGIRSVVRSEVLDLAKSDGKLYARLRIFDDLLSSQPLCFNLFGELREDLALATAVLRDLAGHRVHEVTGIEFEHSPGRGDLRYTGDRSAFDVFVTFQTANGKAGFVAVEVKYHEDLSGTAAPHRDRYDEVARTMGCFADDPAMQLRSSPLQQLWRDHLLAGALKTVDGYTDGVFAFLRPERNLACAKAVRAYRQCLTTEDTFAEWLLEDVVAAIGRHSRSGLAEAIFRRYLDFGRIETELARV